MSIDRLVLGCAQFGMDYGVANRTGKPGLQECNAIVRAAWDGGIRTFDTADAYGTSEAMLGLSLEAIGKAGEARIVTKTSVDPKKLDAAVDASCVKLRCERLHALLIHDENKLCGELFNQYREMAEGLKRFGRIELFGGSFYDCKLAAKALEFVDIVQVPFNLFDNRAWSEGVFDAAKEHGKMVMVRSVYLQGRLLLPPFDTMRWPAFCFNQRVYVDTKTAALNYAFREWRGTPLVVIGAENSSQVVDNLLRIQGCDTILLEEARGVSRVSPSFYDPREWRKR